MFLNVFSQVTILFLLMGLGVVLTRAKVINEACVKGMTDIVVLAVTPCVIIKSFIMEFDSSVLRRLLISSLIALLAHILFILLSCVFFHDKDKARQNVLRLGSIFSNCGFMSLPLQQVLLGDEGVFYASSFIVIYNALVWSYGVIVISGDKKYFSLKKILLSPGILSLLIGLVIFFTSLPVPGIVTQTITYITAINTPLPMIMIGYHMANSNILKGFTDLKCMFAVVSRLVIFPLLVLGLMYFAGIRDTMFISIVISCCAPVGAMTTMLSSKYDSDTNLSANMVSISTLLSIITMPIIVTLAKTIA